LGSRGEKDVVSFYFALIKCGREFSDVVANEKNFLANKKQ